MPIAPTVIDVDLVRCDAFDASRPDRWPQTGTLEYLDGDDVDEVLAWTELFQDVELSAASALTKQLHRVDFREGIRCSSRGNPVTGSTSLFPARSRSGVAPPTAARICS